MPTLIEVNRAQERLGRVSGAFSQAAVSDADYDAARALCAQKMTHLPTRGDIRTMIARTSRTLAISPESSALRVLGGIIGITGPAPVRIDEGRWRLALGDLDVLEKAVTRMRDCLPPAIRTASAKEEQETVQVFKDNPVREPDKVGADSFVAALEERTAAVTGKVTTGIARALGLSPVVFWILVGVAALGFLAFVFMPILVKVI